MEWRESRFLLPILLVVASGAGIPGQQPNSALATLAVNGVLGPPYPFAVTVVTPAPLVMALSGPAGAPFLFAVSAQPPVPGFLFLPAPPPLLFNSLDIVVPPAVVLGRALTATGFGVITVPTNPSFIGSSFSAQAVVILSPTPPFAFVLSAAVSVTFI